MKKMTCFFTGHRYLPEKQIEYIQKSLAKNILAFILLGVREFRTGGALGFDTYAALTVLKFKKFLPEIELHLYLPSADQPKYWDSKDVKIYNEILSRADKVYYAEENPDNSREPKRNRCLAENSDFCICYMRKDTGGTAQKVSYAKKHNIRIIRI